MVRADSVSKKALQVARRLDQYTAVPGRYMVVVDVGVHKKEWIVEFSKLERVGRFWSELDEKIETIKDGF